MNFSSFTRTLHDNASCITQLIFLELIIRVPVPNLPHYFPKIRSSIIFPSTSSSSSGLFPLVSPTKIKYSYTYKLLE